MTRLSVNINKIATLRNARGGNIPDLLKAAVDIQNFGAQGITVHPRPDERHIRYSDVYALSETVHTEFNIEGYPGEKFLDLAAKVSPQQITLVPDPPDVLTSNAGWNTIEHKSFLKETIARIKAAGIRVSIFVDANPVFIEHAAETGADRVELYTERYASRFRDNREKAIAPFVEVARVAYQAGLGVNAGHDLNLDNLRYFSNEVPHLLEVSIGHALISDALYYGLEKTVHLYLAALK
ncbi:MAG: pyridoxine 5'-phosphate synthase [Flavobacteriales bacterium]